MTLLGNIIWFVFGGLLTFLLYTLATIIFFPAFIPIFRLACYAAWPFGRGVVTQKHLTKYREITSEATDAGEPATMHKVGFVLNLLWMLTFGWILALSHLLSALLNLFFFWLILTIPNIGAHWKLMPVALMPFNKKVVPKAVADEVVNVLAKNKLSI